MLDSIDHPIENLLIIDNGGKLAGLQTNSFVKKLTILPMLSNLGVATSWNLGIKNFYQHSVFYFASADMWFTKGDLELLAASSPNHINLHKKPPHWHTFAIGQKIVEKIGLFDEGFYPIYCEDNDFERRAKNLNLGITYLNLQGGHENSATIESDNYYKEKNDITFENNKEYFYRKVKENDFTSGEWSLQRTRSNSWAK
jgi:hypothetical protein